MTKKNYMREEDKENYVLLEKICRNHGFETELFGSTLKTESYRDIDLMLKSMK